MNPGILFAKLPTPVSEASLDVEERTLTAALFHLELVAFQNSVSVNHWKEINGYQSDLFVFLFFFASAPSGKSHGTHKGGLYAQHL